MSVERYLSTVVGDGDGFLAVAFGRNPYWTSTRKYKHAEWTETRFAWPAERDRMLREVTRELSSGEPVDAYVCPALRQNNQRRKDDAQPLAVVWFDLDGPPKDSGLLDTLDPIRVASGQPDHLHGYVRLTRAVDLGTHARLGKALADRLGADSKWSDESLLRLPGTLNHKTNPPSPVTMLPGGGCVWTPDDLAARLGIGVSESGGKATVSVPDSRQISGAPLPERAQEALDNPDRKDRSAAHHRLVGACFDSGVRFEQTAAIVANYPPSIEKYGNRLLDEIARSWHNVVDDGQTRKLVPLKMGTGHATATAAVTPIDGVQNLLANVRNGAWLNTQEFPPLRYAVPGLIAEGLTLLVAPPKAGKSWFVLDLALALASGGNALSTIPTGPARPVFYLALEDGHRRMQTRCRQLLDERPIPALFEYLTEAAPDRVIHTVAAWLDEHNETYPLVILDTLGKVLPPAGPGESAYQRDYRIGSLLKRIIDSYPGAALIGVHHDRKAASDDFVDSVSGTHGLAGSADTVAVLVRPRSDNDGLLKITGRDVTEAEYALTSAMGASWRLNGDLHTAAKDATIRRAGLGLGDRSIDVINVVAAHPNGVGPTDVGRTLGLNANEAGTYLGRLVDAGRLVKRGRGLYALSSVESVESVEIASQGQGSGSTSFQQSHGVPPAGRLENSTLSTLSTHLPAGPDLSGSQPFSSRTVSSVDGDDTEDRAS